MNKLLITKMRIRSTNDVIVIAKCDDFRLKEICFNNKNEYNIGDIFVGRVKKIVNNIQAAFVDIGDKKECYMSLSDVVSPIFTNKKGKNKKLVEGDELLVQISKESVKTKAAVVTSNLSITGKFLVLTSEKKMTGVSNKISNRAGVKLKQFINDSKQKYDNFPYGIIIRTNAKDATNEQLANELDLLYNKIKKVIEKGVYKTCFSKVCENYPIYLLTIKNCYMNLLDEIITDCPDLYDEIKNYLLEYQPEDLGKLRMYEDRMIEMHKLYNLHNQIEDATKRIVWLKSGGYIVIEPTEAMVVVDVNTGKFDGKKKNIQENFLKINKEAAIELANQLVLRNLSGMILVDFISMENNEYVTELIDTLCEELKKDPVKTAFIDITKLGIVEITRKKQKKSIYETLGGF